MQRPIRFWFSADYGVQHTDQAPVLLLHGFDGSSLEFRRLLPLLEERLETWAVDLVGWGFSDSGAASHQDMQLGPKQKRDHLYAFWKEKVILRVCSPSQTSQYVTLVTVNLSHASKHIAHS